MCIRDRHSPDTGDILLNGRSISGLPPHEICHAGIARTFQLNAFFGTMSVMENVLIASQHGHKSIDFQRTYFNSSERRRAESALELVGLSDKAHLTAASLDILGQKLLMIAVAIATDPQLLLLDEPSLGLAPTIVEKIYEHIQQLKKDTNLTILLVEQHAMKALSIADRVYFLRLGEIVTSGKASDLKEKTDFKKIYFGE